MAIYKIDINKVYTYSSKKGQSILIICSYTYKNGFQVSKDVSMHSCLLYAIESNINRVKKNPHFIEIARGHLSFQHFSVCLLATIKPGFANSIAEGAKCLCHNALC